MAPSVNSSTVSNFLTSPAPLTTKIPMSVSTFSTTLIPLSSQQNEKDEASSRALGYIFLSLAAVALILIVMAMALLFLRNRRIDQLRHRLVPLYNFDAAEEDHEDWEAELLEDSSESHKLRRGYKSMEFPSLQS